MSTKKYTIIGGDLRNIKLADLLSKDGNTVNIFGFKNAGFELGTGIYINSIYPEEAAKKLKEALEKEEK